MKWQIAKAMIFIGLVELSGLWKNGSGAGSRVKTRYSGILDGVAPYFLQVVDQRRDGRPYTLKANAREQVCYNSGETTHLQEILISSL